MHFLLSLLFAFALDRGAFIDPNGLVMNAEKPVNDGGGSAPVDPPEGQGGGGGTAPIDPPDNTGGG